MAELKVQKFSEGVVFTAKIIPSSSRTSISGLFDGMLKIKVSAPPQKGKANKCLLEFLAKQLSVKANHLSIVSGKASPVKKIQILGISADALLKRLNLRS